MTGEHTSSRLRAPAGSKIE